MVELLGPDMDIAINLVQRIYSFVVTKYTERGTLLRQQWMGFYEDLSWSSTGESDVTGIRTNISGNVRSSSPSSLSPPKFANFTTVNNLFCGQD